MKLNINWNIKINIAAHRRDEQMLVVGIQLDLQQMIVVGAVVAAAATKETPQQGAVDTAKTHRA